MDNKPFDNGYVVTFKFNSTFKLQIGVDISATVLKVRTLWDGAWRDWHSI